MDCCSFLCTLALFDCLWSFKQWPTHESLPENSLNINHDSFPVLTLFSLWILLGSGNMKNWSADPVGPVPIFFFPYRTQFQIIGPHRPASWATRRVGPPLSVSLVVSQQGIEPGTSCTAGEYCMKRAIWTAIFSCHSGSHLCCWTLF